MPSSSTRWRDSSPAPTSAELRRHIAKATGEPTIPVRDLTRDRDRYDRTLLIERSALVLLAIVLALVGAVLIGQALIRLVTTSAADVDTLVVLGASRGHRGRRRGRAVHHHGDDRRGDRVRGCRRGVDALSDRHRARRSSLMTASTSTPLVVGFGLGVLVLALVGCVAL